MQSPKAKSINKSRMMRGEAAGSVGSAGSSKRRLAANAESAACVRKAVHLEMREAVAAWRAGVSRVLARARLVMKAAASSLQRPPTSMPRTTRRHLELRRSSG